MIRWSVSHQNGDHNLEFTTLYINVLNSELWPSFWWITYSGSSPISSFYDTRYYLLFSIYSCCIPYQNGKNLINFFITVLYQKIWDSWYGKILLNIFCSVHKNPTFSEKSLNFFYRSIKRIWVMYNVNAKSCWKSI